MGYKQVYTSTAFPDKELEVAFREFNLKYFRFTPKKLETLLSVEWDRRLIESGLMGRTAPYRSLTNEREPDRYKILISPKYRDARRVWMPTLLHEMAHFKLIGIDKSRLHCGSRVFQQEMMRLAVAGALKPFW